MLTQDKYLDLRNKASESTESLPELVELINQEFHRELQLAYDKGWDDCLAASTKGGAA